MSPNKQNIADGQKIHKTKREKTSFIVKKTKM
jgi:hypothetical protein